MDKYILTFNFYVEFVLFLTKLDIKDKLSQKYVNIILSSNAVVKILWRSKYHRDWDKV